MKINKKKLAVCLDAKNELSIFVVLKQKGFDTNKENAMKNATKTAKQLEQNRRSLLIFENLERSYTAFLSVAAEVRSLDASILMLNNVQAGGDLLPCAVLLLERAVTKIKAEMRNDYETCELYLLSLEHTEYCAYVKRILKYMKSYI